MLVFNWWREMLGLRAAPCKRARVRAKQYWRDGATLCCERLEDRTLLAAGDLDPTFGVGGVVIQNITFTDRGEDVARQSDGKLIVAGTSNDGSGRKFAVARFNVDGTLDDGSANDTTPGDSFGTGGFVRTGFNANDQAEGRAMLVQPDDKIVVVGFDICCQVALVRYNPDGTLDNTFGTGGRVSAVIGSDISGATEVALQADGKLVVVGVVDSDIFTMRFNTDGTVDTAFGTNGKVVANVSNGDAQANDVAIQADGKIVVVGRTQSSGSFTRLVALRYNPDGSPDVTFANAGTFLDSVPTGGGLEEATGVAIQPDGNIVLGGVYISTDSRGMPVIERLTPQGTLDPTFDGDGRATPDFGFSGQFSNSLALQADGKIVSVGSRTIPGGAGFLVFRLNTDGTLDSTFGSNGFVVTDPADNSNDELFSVLIQPDGNIVGAGTLGVGSSDANFAMVRYLGGIPNNPPVAEAGGPYTVVQGASVVLDASGSTDPDQDPATLSYEWDLDGDGIFGETGPAASRGDEVGIHPIFSADGLVGPSSLTVTLRVTDVAGASNEDTATINVVQAALQDDPCDPGKLDLVVGGTLGNDVILFAPGKRNTIQVSLNGTSLGSFAPTGRLVAYGQSGDDDIAVSSSIALQAWLYGGKGNDHLQGGSGPNVLLGGDDNDELIGGSNRDILIGGAGADHLTANGGEDILIAGTTAFDQDVAALCALLAEWTRTDANYVTRISHLQGTGSGGLNGPYLLTTSTAFDDGAADILTGKAGLDWFFANVQGAGTLDSITDLGKQELVTDL